MTMDVFGAGVGQLLIKMIYYPRNLTTFADPHSLLTGNPGNYSKLILSMKHAVSGTVSETNDAHDGGPLVGILL